MTKAITKTLERDLPNGDHIIATAVLHIDDPSGVSDGFSVTGSIWEARRNAKGRTRRNQGRDIDMGGCLHDEITCHFPKLRPVIAVHLADPDGTPVHALANGWHFYTGESREYELRQYGADYVARQGTDLERAARALHIPVEDLPTGMDKAAFTAFVESLRPRWAQQAATAIETLEDIA